MAPSTERAARVAEAVPRTSSSPRSISVRRAQGRVVVSVHGHVDGPRAAILEQVLSDLIEGQGNLDVLVDLRDAALAHPVALDALRGAAEQARRRNAAFAFRAPVGAAAERPL